jgi:hypothetical protein
MTTREGKRWRPPEARERRGQLASEIPIRCHCGAPAEYLEASQFVCGEHHKSPLAVKLATTRGD